MSNPITQGKATGAASSTSGTLSADGWPTFSPTQVGDTPFGAFVSPDPTEMANAWEIPANNGTLRLPTGISTQVPTSAKDLTLITQSVQMIDLYGKLSSGQKLSPAEVAAATQLGGDIARAAQMQGAGPTVIPAHEQPGTMDVKGGKVTSSSPTRVPAQKVTPQTKGAVGAALTEIGVRLKNVGISPQDLANYSTATVSSQFSTMLQNAGYAVTKNMTLTQMLQETAGPKAQQPLPTMSQGMSIGEYVQGLGNLTKSQINQLQQSMYNSGLYDQQYYDGSKAYTQGVLDTGTILAFRKAMQLSLSTNHPLEGVIGGNLPIPTTGGSAADQAVTPASGSNANNTVPTASDAQLQNPLIKAFEATIGRAPSQSELETFRQQYNQSLQDANRYALNHGLDPQTSIDLQTGVPYLPQAPTASNAAASFAMNSNPVEYQAHGIANAFGMLMNLVDRSNTSALDTLGRSPNMSS